MKPSESETVIAQFLSIEGLWTDEKLVMLKLLILAEVERRARVRAEQGESAERSLVEK